MDVNDVDEVVGGRDGLGGIYKSALGCDLCEARRRPENVNRQFLEIDWHRLLRLNVRNREWVSL